MTSMPVTLSMTEEQHRALRQHLFPGDGNEAVALLLCSRRAGRRRHRLLVRKVVLVPYTRCPIRTPTQVTWPTDILPPLLQEAERQRLAIVKVHSHPGGLAAFSGDDNEADVTLFPCVHAWVDNGLPHASAIMLPGGKMFGRAFLEDGSRYPLDRVSVVGDDLLIWHDNPLDCAVREFALRHAQAFGKASYTQMSRLSIGVVGCSGTGSIVIEQLHRYGVERLVLVDPKRVEERNLNRILNAKRADIGRFKVDVIAEFIRDAGIVTAVEPFARDISDLEALMALGECDVVFGCMDGEGVDGRAILNRLATFYLLPYIDLGVALEADGRGGVEQICGSVNYLLPGQSSLMTRGLYTDEQVRAASMKRHNPDGYKNQVAAGYIKGVREDRPAVISVNMFFGSLAVMELLARLHPYRDEPNTEFAAVTYSLTGTFILCRREGPTDEALCRYVGRGDMSPFLNMPLLGRPSEVG